MKNVILFGVLFVLCACEKSVDNNESIFNQITGNVVVLTRTQVGVKHIPNMTDDQVRKIVDMYPDKKSFTLNDLGNGKQHLDVMDKEREEMQKDIDDGAAATRRFQEEKAAKKAARQIHMYGPASGSEALFILTGFRGSVKNVNNETILNYCARPNNMVEVDSSVRVPCFP